MFQHDKKRLMQKVCLKTEPMQVLLDIQHHSLGTLCSPYES